MKIFTNFDSKVTIKEYEANEIIANEGDICHGLYYIYEGDVVIKSIYRNGHESILKYVYEKEIFGDILLFSDYSAFPASIISLTKTKIGFVKKNDLIQYMNLHPDFSIHLIEKISNQAFELNNRVKLLTKKNIRSKIAYFLVNESNKHNSLTFNLNISREKMATLLNVERPSLSRELIKFKNDGIIDFYRQTIKIIDKDKILEYI